MLLSPTDNRLGLAWKRIGGLFEQQLHNGIEAIQAYKQATQYGLEFPQLEEFQSGLGWLFPRCIRILIFFFHQ